MQELFEKIKANEEDILTDISISYLEVYNETICDLLISEGGRGRSLALREDQNGVMVAGLSEHHPKTVGLVLRHLQTICSYMYIQLL
jgi:kinesin family protein 18/19